MVVLDKKPEKSLSTDTSIREPFIYFIYFYMKNFGETLFLEFSHHCHKGLKMASCIGKALKAVARRERAMRPFPPDTHFTDRKVFSPRRAC